LRPGPWECWSTGPVHKARGGTLTVFASSPESVFPAGRSRGANAGGRMACMRGNLTFHRGPESAPFAEAAVEGSIPRRFEEIVRGSPDRPAIRAHRRQWSYRTLNRAANRIAHTLLARLGTGPEPVALLFGQGIPMTAAIFGVLKTGKFYVPLDPSFPLELLGTMAEDAEPRLVLTDPGNLPLAGKLVRDKSRILTLDILNS